MTKKKRTDGVLEVRVTSRATNAILARFADECGSIKAAAAKVGVSNAAYSNWLHFRSVPLDAHGGITGRQRKRVRRLVRLTKRRAEEIFPLTKEQVASLVSPRVMEHEVSCARLTSVVAQQQITHVLPADKLLQKEAREHIVKVLKTLSYREREIINMRYGLREGYCYTLEEVAATFRTTRERVRQIEAKAVRALQQPSRAAELIDFLDMDWSEDRSERVEQSAEPRKANLEKYPLPESEEARTRREVREVRAAVREEAAALLRHAQEQADLKERRELWEHYREKVNS